MKPRISRQFVLLAVAFAVAAGSLLVPDPASAAKALFRVQRKFFGGPFPADTPGGAGVVTDYFEPRTSVPPATATVGTTSPVPGTAFTLPRSFIDYYTQYTLFPASYFPGYTTIGTFSYFNGEARFRPSNPHGPVSPTTRVVFPTTGGNGKVPNKGTGYPATETTTHMGYFDSYRAGSLNIKRGANKFGGTLRLLARDPLKNVFYQYITYSTPFISKGYGSFRCTKMGVDCTDTTSTGDGNTIAGIGELTSSGMVSRFRLETTTTYTTMSTTFNGTATNTFTNEKKGFVKATTGAGNVTSPGEYIINKQYYLHLIAPWTTGDASAFSPFSYFNPNIRPQYAGYDKNLGGANVTFTTSATNTNKSYIYNTKKMTTKTVTTTTTTYPTSMVVGVERVVSLVRPRLLWSYRNPSDPNNPFDVTYQGARVWTMKVFFLPEPGGMLLLGVGAAALAGLAFFRRR